MWISRAWKQASIRTHGIAQRRSGLKKGHWRKLITDPNAIILLILRQKNRYPMFQLTCVIWLKESYVFHISTTLS